MLSSSSSSWTSRPVIMCPPDRRHTSRSSSSRRALTPSSKFGVNSLNDDVVVPGATALYCFNHFNPGIQQYRLMNNHKKVRINVTFWNNFYLLCMQNVTKYCVKAIKRFQFTFLWLFISLYWRRCSLRIAPIKNFSRFDLDLNFD